MTKIAIAIVAAPFLFLAGIGAYAAQPVNTGTIAVGENAPPTAMVTVGPVEQVTTPAPVLTKATHKPTKAHKHVCDKRGHTVSVGMAKMVYTVNKSDTGVTVCWTE